MKAMTHFQKWDVNPKRDLNLGPSRIAVFEDCKATANHSVITAG